MIKKLSLFFVLLLVTACTTVKSGPIASPVINAATSPTTTQDVVVTSSPTQETVDMTIIRYLALGDSYTIGESVDETERWSNQLADLLSLPLGRGLEVTIIARTGWTVQELWQGIQASPPEGTYDMVSLLIGVNDQYRGYPVDGYREDFRFMLGKAIEYAGGDPKHVIVLSIPDWGITPFAKGRDREQITKDINLFNSVNREETEKAGAHYVDITLGSRDAAQDQSLLASDGLHPSGKMYALWAEQALPIALNILEADKGE